MASTLQTCDLRLWRVPQVEHSFTAPLTLYKSRSMPHFSLTYSGRELIG